MNIYAVVLYPTLKGISADTTNLIVTALLNRENISFRVEYLFEMLGVCDYNILIESSKNIGEIEKELRNLFKPHHVAISDISHRSSQSTLKGSIHLKEINHG